MESVCFQDFSYGVGGRGGSLKSKVIMILPILLPASAFAHVGSKDVFETVHAGPYTLYVTVRPPNVIPGVATV